MTKESSKVPVSIYTGYPFTEQWEVSLCRCMINEAMRWGKEQDVHLSKQRREKEVKFYSNYGNELFAYYFEN